MKVVVAGAGYAGTIAANRLAKKVPAAEVTVVNPRPDFVERVRLHEQISGTGAAGSPLSRMLRDGITVHLASAERVEDGVLALDDGARLDFDHLVIAVGSTARPMPGTVPVGTWEGAEQAREALAGLADGETVTVVGAGLTGAETASEIAAARPGLRVRLIGEELVPSLGPGARARVAKGLERLGVEFLTDRVEEVRTGAAASAASRRQGAAEAEGAVPPPGAGVDVGVVTAAAGAAVEEGAAVATGAAVADGACGASRAEGLVRLRSGAGFTSGLTLWAIVAGVPPLVARSGLRVDEDGRAIVDEFLRSVSDPRVFVVGDCAAVPGARMACATAAPQGAYAADTLARSVRGRNPRPFSMGYVGQAMSLGRRDGLIQVTGRDDHPRGLFLSGRIAAVSKETACRYAEFGARTAVYGWAPGPVKGRRSMES